MVLMALAAAGAVSLGQMKGIRVSVVGKLVALTGDVRRPAIYELKHEKILSDLVRMGGDFAPTAYKRCVQVERLEGHIAKIVLDINAVTLEGNVVRPGKYELKPGMTVASLLPDVNTFLPRSCRGTAATDHGGARRLAHKERPRRGEGPLRTGLGRGERARSRREQQDHRAFGRLAISINR